MAGDWQLDLEQESDLSVASGRAAAVAEAVRASAELRVYLTTPTYEETLYFQQTYAGEGDAFAGIMSHHHSYSYDGQQIDKPYVSLFKYDTSGRISHVKWLLGDDAVDVSSKAAYGVYRWFVCDRWRAVYEHDADGNPVAGDLDELVYCVRSADHRLAPVRSALCRLASVNSSASARTTWEGLRTPAISPPCNPLFRTGRSDRTAISPWSAHLAILSTGRTDCTWPSSVPPLQERSSVSWRHRENCRFSA